MKTASFSSYLYAQPFLYHENQSQCRMGHASQCVLLHRAFRQRDNLTADPNGKYHILVAVKHVLDYPTLLVSRVPLILLTVKLYKLM